MSITGSGAGYQFGFTPEDTPVIEDFIPKEIAPIEPGSSAQSFFKAGDALTVDSKGNAKKAEPGDPVLGYALPEGKAKLTGKTLVDVFKNESPIDSEIQWSNQMKADLLKATEVSRKAREEYNREFPPSLNGYRPTCCLCRKPVDRFEYWRQPEVFSVRFRAQCHGRVEQMEISDGALRYGSRRTMFDIIESRGFFRSDAEEARKRDNYPPQYVRDMDGNITAVRYPDFANDEYDGPKFDTKAIRDIEEQMQLQAYREMLKITGSLVTPGLIGTIAIGTTGNRYTASGSASSPKKPTKAELLAMLAEIEKTEAKPAMLELDQQRVIDL